MDLSGLGMADAASRFSHAATGNAKSQLAFLWQSAQTFGSSFLSLQNLFAA
jgi:hypothetical protein